MLIKSLTPNLQAGRGINEDASVINMSCLKGTFAAPGMMSYCMSKAAVESMTKSFALNLGHKGVRVNSVSASFLNSKFNFPNMESDVNR